jgi:TRAP-type C4-dicarboxylate transport system permease small subunit
MRTLFGKIATSVHGLARGLRILGQLALAAMVVTICYDVVARYVFEAPTLWSLEVNTFLVLFIALIPAGDVLKAGMHLRITFFVERGKPGLQRVLDKAGALTGIAFCGFMAWKGWTMAMQAWRYHERMSTALGTPMVIPYMFIPIGFAVLGLGYVVKLFGGNNLPD